MIELPNKKDKRIEIESNTIVKAGNYKFDIAKKPQDNFMKIRILEPNKENWYRMKKKGKNYVIADQNDTKAQSFLTLDIGDIKQKGIQGIAFVRGVPCKRYSIGNLGELKAPLYDVGEVIQWKDFRSQAIRIEYAKLKLTSASSSEDKIKAVMEKYTKDIVNFLSREYNTPIQFKIMPKEKDFKLLLDFKGEGFTKLQNIKIFSIAEPFESRISVEQLTNAFKLSSEKALELFNLLQQAEKYESRYEDVEEALKVANEYLNGSGVESLKQEGYQVNNYYYEIIAEYINLGDTYDTTLVYDTENNQFLICSWGDFLEEWEGEQRKVELYVRERQKEACAKWTDSRADYCDQCREVWYQIMRVVSFLGKVDEDSVEFFGGEYYCNKCKRFSLEDLENFVPMEEIVGKKYPFDKIDEITFADNEMEEEYNKAKKIRREKYLCPSGNIADKEIKEKIEKLKSQVPNKLEIYDRLIAMKDTLATHFERAFTDEEIKQIKRPYAFYVIFEEKIDIVLGFRIVNKKWAWDIVYALNETEAVDNCYIIKEDEDVRDVYFEGLWELANK